MSDQVTTKVTGEGWYVSIGEKKYGAFSEKKLMALIKNKKIPNHAKIRTKSMPKWESILNSKFADLMGKSKAPPPLTDDVVKDSNETDTTSTIDWHFSIDGKRFGPHPEERIIQLIDRKRINEYSLVWNDSMTEWENILKSKFADLIRDPKAPPPLAGDAVNNTIVWLLAFAIIIGLFAEGLISGLTGISQDYLFFITIGLNIWLCTLDEKKLKEAGHDTSDMGATWLVPVYLFKRAKKLKHNYAYFIVWCIIFGLYLFE